MEKQLKKWQDHWRKVMGLPTDIKNDISCDFELHFDIWNLEKSQFFKCFEIFPKGTQIAERAYRLKNGDLGVLNEQMNKEEQLIAEAKKSIEEINKLVESKELDNPDITIRYGDSKLRLELLKQTDYVSIEVDDILSDLIINANGEEAYNAYFFLREPMYRFASSYIPSNWILWTLTNFTDIDPYTPLLKLYYNNCDVAISNEGVLIFKSTKNR